MSASASNIESINVMIGQLHAVRDGIVRAKAMLVASDVSLAAHAADDKPVMQMVVDVGDHLNEASLSLEAATKRLQDVIDHFPSWMMSSKALREYPIGFLLVAKGVSP